MLGSSRMVNQDQIRDCLSRGWVVISPNHRLCPQVNLLEGPIQDCRDLLSWIYSGGLMEALEEQKEMINLDLNKVYAMGTSSGGTLALALVSVALKILELWECQAVQNESTKIWH
jgi:acetyl esterase/lipase